MKKVELIRSDTWLTDNYDNAEIALTKSITEFVGEYDKIINIQLVNNCGLYRYWIYIEVGENEQNA